MFKSSKSSSQTKSSEGSSGIGAYRLELEYDSDTKKRGKTYTFKPEDLLTKLLSCPDFEDEKIEEVTIYRYQLDESDNQNLVAFRNGFAKYIGSSYIANILVNPLTPFKLGHYFHAFAVIKTEYWFYSVDKYCSHVGLQRSRCIEHVRDYEGRKLRLKIDAEFILKVKSAPGKGTMEDLVRIIHSEGIVSKEYHWLTDNCKHTAACIFNKASQGTCTVGLLGDLQHPCERITSNKSIKQ